MKKAYLRLVLGACVLLGGGGCAQSESAQQALLGLAAKAVGQVRQEETQRQQVMLGLFAGRRQRLDEGFDQDVLGRANLDGPWVIEHRKAYVAALEAMLQQQTATRQGQETTLRNLEAIDLALEKLTWFSAIRANWTEVLQMKETKNEK